MSSSRLGEFASAEVKKQIDDWAKEHIQYFEVILDPDGNLLPLRGSHQMNLLEIFCSQFGLSSHYEAEMAIPKRHLGSIEYLAYTTDHLPVWYNFYQGKPNIMQLYTLYYAKRKGVYAGEILNPYE